MTVIENPFEGLEVSPPPEPKRGDDPTEKQVRFLSSLISERPSNKTAETARAALDNETATKADASKWIDELLSAPKEPKADVPEPPEAIHEVDGVVYKVQRAVHGSGKLYAKRLTDDGDWDYEGRKPLHRLSESTVMTLDRARSLGRVYGMCVKCGATLTDETSIERGIGPICEARW